MKGTSSTDARQAGSRLEQRIGHLWRVGLLVAVMGLPVVFGGAPALANAGATVVAQHAQPAQMQSVKPFGNCPSALAPC